MLTAMVPLRNAVTGTTEVSFGFELSLYFPRLPPTPSLWVLQSWKNLYMQAGFWAGGWGEGIWGHTYRVCSLLRKEAATKAELGRRVAPV